MDSQTTRILVDVACDKEALRKLLATVPDRGVFAAVLVVSKAARVPVLAYGAAGYDPIVYADDWRRIFEAETKALADKVNEIEELLAQAGVAGEAFPVLSDVRMIEELLAEPLALSDVVFVPRDLFSDDAFYQRCLRAALFASPVGVVVNSHDIGAALAAQLVFIAWNGGISAARAVHRALPILKQAKEVTVAVVEPVSAPGEPSEPGAALAAWLSRHGCRVTLQQYPGGGREIGDSLLAAASEHGAGLVVMGAYTHSHLRQRMFGGTTQTMIEQDRQAVLFAH